MGLLHAGLLCCSLLALASCTGAQESLWCFIEDVTNTGISIPSLPEQYSTNIELNFENHHYTDEMRRTVDRKLNRSAVEIWARNRHVKYIVLQNESTFLTIDYKEKGPSCSAKKISGNKIQDLFLAEDKVIVNALTGLERLVSTNKTKFMYTGPDNIKSIYAQQWETCAFVSEINDAIDAKISFADVMWKPAHPEYPTPAPASNMFGMLMEIYMKIPGKLFGSNDYTDLITADFSHFLPFAPADDEFQPPEDVHCTDFRTDVKSPSIRNYFRYNSEVIEHTDSSGMAAVVSHETVYYDYKAGLVRFDIQESSSNEAETTTPLGTVVASIIRDIKAGIEYTIFPSSGICDIGALDGVYDVFGTKLLSDEGVLDPMKYFYLDRAGISYLGQYSNRGLMSDVFSSRTTVNGESRILRWYFTADKVQMTEDDRVQKNVLAKMVSKLETSSGKKDMTEINFYNFVEEEPSIFTFDVSFCYNETLLKTFILSFPGDMNPFMHEAINPLKQKVYEAIKEATGLSQTRVSVQEVILTSTHLYAQFTMADILPIGTNPEKITLNEAVNKLETAVSDGALKITMNFQDNSVVLRADPSGLREYSKEENTQIIHQGFSQGSVVGLAFGMILLGFLMGGAVINLLITRKHGVSLFQKALFGNQASGFNNPLNESSM